VVEKIGEKNGEHGIDDGEGIERPLDSAGDGADCEQYSPNCEKEKNQVMGCPIYSPPPFFVSWLTS